MLSDTYMPDDTTAKNWTRLREHATDLKLLFPEDRTLTVTYIHSELRVISDSVGDVFFAPCSETSTQPCHLVDEFDSFNRFLGEINMEFSEKELGRIGLHHAPVPSNEFQWRWKPFFLLHWLLKHHRCIKALDIVDLTLAEYVPLVCDALHLSCGLEELVLGKVGEAMLHTVSTMPRTLMKLRVDVGYGSIKALGPLRTALQRVSELTSIKVSCLSIDACSAESLLSAMSACRSLVELSIPENFLFPRGGAALAEFVAESTALRMLSLSSIAVKECVETKTLETFFEGLASNRSLEVLRLFRFSLRESAMGLLVEAVAHISTLKILSLDSADIDGDALAELVACNTGLCKLLLYGCKANYVAAFSRAIRKTKLQKLELAGPLSNMEMQNYKELLTALSCNQSLQKLVLHIPDDIVSEVCELVRETETESRVEFPVFCRGALESICAMKCFTGTQFEYQRSVSPHTLPDALSKLIHYHKLKSLLIENDGGYIDSECCSGLARFLSRTTTLKYADFRFRTTAESTKALLDAILRNRSLSKLKICNWTFESSDIELLCDIIRTKKNLSELHLGLMEFSTVSSLEEPLWSNLNLLKVTIGKYRDDHKVPFQERIRVATQRNSSMLRCAVQFVMGSNGRRYAEAFEKILDLPTLVEAVQKAANKPEEEAKEMVRNAKRHLDYNFLAAVGVVRNAVVCEPNGQVQLDGIGLDNWFRIRQYLRVADILPEPRGGGS